MWRSMGEPSRGRTCLMMRMTVVYLDSCFKVACERPGHSFGLCMWFIQPQIWRLFVGTLNIGQCAKARPCSFVCATFKNDIIQGGTTTEIKQEQWGNRKENTWLFELIRYKQVKCVVLYQGCKMMSNVLPPSITTSHGRPSTVRSSRQDILFNNKKHFASVEKGVVLTGGF